MNTGKPLFSAPNGWFLAVDTKKDGAYRLWMSFEENERVGMLSDMDATFSKAGETSVVPCISSWRLKALLAPSLIFLIPIVIYIFWRILRGRITEEVILRG